jgi:hypothetical protein
MLDLKRIWGFCFDTYNWRLMDEINWDECTLDRVWI